MKQVVGIAGATLSGINILPISSRVCCNPSLSFFYSPLSPKQETARGGRAMLYCKESLKQAKDCMELSFSCVPDAPGCLFLSHFCWLTDGRKCSVGRPVMEHLCSWITLHRAVLWSALIGVVFIDLKYFFKVLLEIVPIFLHFLFLFN